jgi:DNA helicase-2/ATP-dependent DNA helicase PcrA
METTPRLVALHGWLIELAYGIDHTPLEHMLDTIVGHNQPVEEGNFISPLYAHFFSAEKLQTAPDEYLTYLEALRTIRGKLREYQPDEEPTLHTFTDFIALHKQRGSTISSTRSASTSQADAVHLMTAHKSKGREFDTVYVIGAVDSNWGERVRTRNRLINYPDNLPLAVAGDTWQERLRLFFVAMTRAKIHLTMSYSMADGGGKSTLRASFLSGDAWQPRRIPANTSATHAVTSAETAWYQPVIQPLESELRELLAPMLESYKLSATHLGNFLDVTRGGPSGFLVNNLLRFPQAISPSAAYGSAIHAALQRAHSHLSATGVRRPIEDILHDFEENLSQRHLKASDYSLFLQKGSDALSSFLAHSYDSFNPKQKVELSFAGQSVFVGEAHLTGSLDLVEIDGSSITVTDYKTGHPSTSWAGKADYEKIKLHRYKQQLMFYQLLINNSRDYNRYTVSDHIIQYVEPTSSGDVVALHADFTTDEYERFTRLVTAVWKHITTLDLPDTSSYEQSYRGILAFEAALVDEVE